MKKNYFILIFIVSTALFFFVFFLHPYPSGTILTTKQLEPKETILLLPLDSRPPCKEFVHDAALIANTKIIMPPHEILDYYTAKSDPKPLKKWLKENIKNTNGAIISIDQLLHGGLIASREGLPTQKDYQELIFFLKELHNVNPLVPIYAISILPRITPPPSIGGYSLWKDFIEFSQLTDKLSLRYDEENYHRLQELKKELPKEDQIKYLALFDKNHALNKELSLLVKDGTLERLIIGQDDGEEYGIPNIKKRAMAQFLKKEGISSEKVFLTHGADEIALSMLAKIIAQKNDHKLKIHIAYNSPTTPNLIMPYMAGTVAETIEEKLDYFGAKIVSSPQEANFTFYISCVTPSLLDTRLKTAREIKKLINQNYDVALVDLSKGFLAEETVFPFLVKENVPLHQLIAYAGWNTTSNAIGTALSQAIIFNTGLKNAADENEYLNTYQKNITFLDNRFLEDYYYLKDIIDTVNISLRRAGYTNVNDLDLRHNYQWANSMLQENIKNRADILSHTKAFRSPIKITFKNTEKQLFVNDLNVYAYFPWPRTFEIYLKTTPTIYISQ